MAEVLGPITRVTIWRGDKIDKDYVNVEEKNIVVMVEADKTLHTEASASPASLFALGINLLTDTAKRVGMPRGVLIGLFTGALSTLESKKEKESEAAVPLDAKDIPDVGDIEDKL